LGASIGWGARALIQVRVSKAFTREDDRVPPPEPKGARRAAPRYLTQRGRERLQAHASALLASGDQPQASALGQRIEAAQVVAPRASDDTNPVRFGDVVTLRVDGAVRTYQIVSPDEADLPPEPPDRLPLSSSSPLAQALIGAEPGDIVVVDLPTGAELEALLLAVGPTPGT